MAPISSTYGVEKGLAGPPIELPFNGYTFCAWMRIESFEDPSRNLWYEPRLFRYAISSLLFFLVCCPLILCSV